MAQQIVNNADSGLVARNKINENFDELYNTVGDLHWEKDGDYLRPIDALGVDVQNVLTESLNVNNLTEIQSDGTVISNKYGSEVAAATREFEINQAGEVATKMRGAQPYEIVSGNFTLNEGHYGILAVPVSAQVVLTLPVITADMVGKPYSIRRTPGLFNAVLQAQGTDVILSDLNAAGSSSYALTGLDEWLIIRAVEHATVYFWVIEAHGNQPEGGDTARAVKVVTEDYSIQVTDAAVLGGHISNNIELSLPSGVADLPVTIRKTNGVGLAMTVLRSGADWISFNGADVTGITTTTIGAWVKLMYKQSEAKWYVIEGGENWSQAL